MSTKIFMFLAALFIIIKRGKQYKCPSLNVNILWYISQNEILLINKKIKIMLQATPFRENEKELNKKINFQRVQCRQYDYINMNFISVKKYKIKKKSKIKT